MSVKSLISTGTRRETRLRIPTWLKPVDNGPREIRALDGLRAMAALSIVVFHTLHTVDVQSNPIRQFMGNVFWYLPTGVHLFFVLSGFLLFLPFARAILLAHPLPGLRRFYYRRALRIMPAYLVVLALLAWLPTADHIIPISGASILTHIFMIHDMFPDFNREMEGPFWTLAVEAQFYLLLPLMAAALAKVVGGSRSLKRLLCGIALLLALALGLRALDIGLVGGMPAHTTSGFARSFVLITMGMQGKYLEVFMMGMLASVVYVVTVEFGNMSTNARRRLGWAMLAMWCVTTVLAIPSIRYGGTIFSPGESWGVGVLIYPLVVGVSYASLLLAIIWGSLVIRWFFETPPLRFTGHISYSLYLWHVPVLLAMIPFFAGVPLLLRLVCTVPVAYLSYQLVERPFLVRRRSTGSAELRAPAPIPVPVLSNNSLPTAMLRKSASITDRQRKTG